MTQEKTALVVDPTRQALYTGFVAGQAGYPNVSIRRSASRTINEINTLGCNFDLVVIIDQAIKGHSPGIDLLQFLRDGGFEGLIVFFGDPTCSGVARAIGGESFEWAASTAHLEALVRVSQHVPN